MRKHENIKCDICGSSYNLKYKILLYSWVSLKWTTLKLKTSTLCPTGESHTRLPETQAINQTLKLIGKIKIFNLILCKKSNFIQSQ